MRVAVLQRVIPAYRVSLLAAIASADGLDLRCFIGDDLVDSKIRSAADLSSLSVERLRTRWIRIRASDFALHRGLLGALERFAPDVILCEGESHVVGMLAALAYRVRHPRTALVHWSLGGLPGEPLRRSGLRGLFRSRLRRAFDGFVSYSSYGKKVLVADGVDPARVRVATNVADVRRMVAQAEGLEETPAEARAKLGLPERFTALYVGQVDPSKRLDVWLEAARGMTPSSVSIVIAGEGPTLEPLRRLAAGWGVSCLFTPGRVSDALPLYFRAADVLVLPGLGGIVISEAMAYGLPVVAYRADGTERDLIAHGETGLLLERGDADALRAAMERLRDDPRATRSLGEAGRRRALERFTQESMRTEIRTALAEAVARRSSR